GAGAGGGAGRGGAGGGGAGDAPLLERARAKAPTIPWHRGDLATLRADEVPGPFDAIVLAGNVMIFVAPGTEGAVLHNLASRLAPGGLLVAGFQLRDGGLTPDGYDEFTRAAGLAPHARAATWDGDPFTGGDYLVAIDQLTNRR
ncbi:MAG: SAM-dependent methyltransferase, partial [Acidimicrobiia bacterium]